MKRLRLVKESNLSVPEKYTAQYMASDGYTKEKTFTGPNAKKELKEWIDEWVGLDGEIAETHNYIVSRDGVGRIAVKGIWLTDLLEKEKGPEKKGDDYLINLLETSVLLTYPHIAKSSLRNQKIESSGYPSMVLDWSKFKTVPYYGREKEVKEGWRWICTVSENPYAKVPTIEVSITAVMFNTLTPEAYRPIDKRFDFPSKDKEHDIDTICDFLESLKPEMDKIDFGNDAKRLT
jgi:hypothetical protein